MNLKPEELSEHGFELQEELEHKDLPIFLKKYLNKLSYISILFYSINLVFLFIAIGYFIANLKMNYLNIFDWTYRYLLGFTFAFLLIPLHEYLHVLAYKSQGAKNTSYDYNLKKFFFMALADKFVANRKEFRIVALTPFVVITLISLLLWIFADYNYTLTILGILFCHTAMSSGDFALLNYFELNRNMEIVTYDDVSLKVSYFYKKEFF